MPMLENQNMKVSVPFFLVFFSLAVVMTGVLVPVKLELLFLTFNVCVVLDLVRLFYSLYNLQLSPICETKTQLYSTSFMKEVKS